MLNLFLKASPTRSPELIIWSACIGIIVALIFAFVIRKVQGDFVSRLLNGGAADSSSALSLEQVKSSRIIKAFLKDGSGLRQVVSRTEDNRYFIAEEHRDKASCLFKGNMKWYFLPLFAILIVALSYVITLLIPYML